MRCVPGGPAGIAQNSRMAPPLIPPGLGWRAALVALLLGAGAVGALYFAGFASLVSVWSSTVAYRFLFLVPVLSLYFLWLRWPEVRVLQPRPSALGLLYALPFGALWLFAAATQLAIGAQVAAVGMLQAVFLAVLGWPVCRRLLFPLLLLWLMVPVGDLLVPRLMELTTALTIAGLHLAGMPATADGNLLVAGGARYSIIQECSGLDFLLGNLLVSLVFANLIYRGTGRKLLYVLAAVPVAILANNLRTTSVILITAGGIDLAADHSAYGWFLFLVAMVGQMAVGVRYRDPPGGRYREPPRDLPEAAVTTPLVLAAGGLLLVAAVAPAYARYGLDRDAGPVAVRLCLPPGLRPVAGLPAVADDWRPAFPAADATVHGVLPVAGRPVDLHVAYYWRQRPGSELISWENRFHDGAHWRYMAEGSATADFAGRTLAVATERLAGPAGQRRLAWYWYWVDGQFTSRPGVAKLHQARAVLFGGDQRAAVIAVSVEESGNAAADGAALQAALDRQPALMQMLKAAARDEDPGRGCS